MEQSDITDESKPNSQPNVPMTKEKTLSECSSFLKDSTNSSESSTNSNDQTMSAECNIEGELECGSEARYRFAENEKRALFYMEDDEKSSPTHPFGKNIDGRKITVGICAMAKKTNSKPMKEILGRLDRFEYLQIIVFSEDVICNSPVDDWPVVDALISFFSVGFPLQKAIQYKNLRKPFVINDLEAQYALKDRREVYKILVREGIAHPRYAVMNREDIDTGDFGECEDAIEVNGVSFQRPFVEKPVCAEDHNVYIYFPVSAGGGCQRLFRKVGSRSSVYSTVNRVRKTGSYIYEDFMPTDGTDVKVYTVGPDYAHAEARKSPALDGKVERDKDGKEVRFPVLLSSAEKLIARKVCMAFKQNVCGFDLLRASGKSYVCDVNGFSFVKNSTKYYDDCANVLGTMIIRTLAPQLHIPLVLGAAPEDIPVVPTTSGSMMELRCVVGVIRHGDRTPKQKMKMEVKHKRFFELFEKYDGYRKGHLKLKKPKQLQEVLDIARDLLSERNPPNDPEVLEKKAKLRQLKLVLEMYGHFSGINRKVQLKYQPHGAPLRSSSEEAETRMDEDTGSPDCPTTTCTFTDEVPREPSLVLILKWGGELTPAGKYQAEDLGKAFRTLYPGGQGEFEMPGLGFLRLHSTFRHDLKIYASDEGRVQMTAAAFTKGLLALEGELTPILVSMVKSANTNGLLDKEGETSKYQHLVKDKMMDMFNQDHPFTDEDIQKLCPTGSTSLMKAVKYIRNPRQMCDRLFQMVSEITARIRTLKLELKSRDLKLYHGESWELLMRRWAKLEKDFKMKDGNFDISKIPDIYDCIKYDLEHNQKILQYNRADELLICSKALADVVIPQEYGITVEEKLHISQSICTPLMRKIHRDLYQGCQVIDDEESTRLNSKYSKGVSSPERFVRTRLYFTSESHIHSLLNMIRYGGLCEEIKDEQWKKAMDFLSSTPELNYMTQIVIMMYEDASQDMLTPERFHVELHFSPGAYTTCDKNVVNPVSSGYRTIQLKAQQGTSKDVKKDDTVIRAEKIMEEPEDTKFESQQSTVKRTDLGQEVEESNTLTSIQDLTRSRVNSQCCPGSPDPDIPEWDWGDNNQDTTKSSDVTLTETRSDTEGATDDSMTTEKHSPRSSVVKDTSPMNLEIPMPTPNTRSRSESPADQTSDSDTAETVTPSKGQTTSSAPIEIKVPGDEDRKMLRANSFDGTQSYEGKRSRSLEDKDCDGEYLGDMGLSCSKDRRRQSFSYPFRYSLSDVFSSDTSDGVMYKTMMEKHYLTIHLPIGKDRHYHSFSSLLYLNPEAFKGSYSVPDLASNNVLLEALFLQESNRRRGKSARARLVGGTLCRSSRAFDGFNMVPSLKPLETLHNRLTMKDMDKFLSRVTTSKFFTPATSPMINATPLVSPRQTIAQSLPSSSNSSAGPSSPTSASAPVDFMTKVKMYVLATQKAQCMESLSESSSQTSNQQLSPGQVTHLTNQDAASAKANLIGSSGADHAQLETQAVKQKGSSLQGSDATSGPPTIHSNRSSNDQIEGVGTTTVNERETQSKTVLASDVPAHTTSNQPGYSTVARIPQSQKAGGGSHRSPVFHVTHVQEDSIPLGPKADPSPPATVSSPAEKPATPINKPVQADIADTRAPDNKE